MISHARHTHARTHRHTATTAPPSTHSRHRRRRALRCRLLPTTRRSRGVACAQNGVQIAANNASLAVLELSMNQVVRSVVPVLTAALGVCIEAKVPTWLELLALGAVSAGVILCVYEVCVRGASASPACQLSLPARPARTPRSLS